MRRLVCLFPLVCAAATAAAAEDVLPPQIVHEPCEYYQKGQSLTIVALFYDDSPIFDPKVLYRTGKVSEWRNASFTKSPIGNEFVAVIKARDLKGPLEYFLETFDENGNGPARYGSPDSPVRLLPSENAPECSQIGAAAAMPLTTMGTSQTPESVKAPTPAPPAREKEPGGKKAGAEPIDKPVDKAAVEAPVKKVEPPRVPVTPLPAAVVTAPPPPAEQGCGSDDPPLYCSPVFWSVVGVVVVAAGTTGGILGWCYASGPCKGAEEPELPDRVAVVVGGGDLSSAFGLTF